MKVWGLCAKLVEDRPLVIGVEAERTDTGIEAHEVFRHLANPAEDEALQLRSLAAHLRTEITRSAPTIVLIRGMDKPPFGKARKETVNSRRYHVDGVMLATCREVAATVDAKPGVQLGDVCGISKAELDQRALDLLGADAAEAGAAALAALDFEAARTRGAKRSPRRRGRKPGARPRRPR
jgi:hypothetical protein